MALPLSYHHFYSRFNRVAIGPFERVFSRKIEGSNRAPKGTGDKGQGAGDRNTPIFQTDGTINHKFFAPDCFHFSQWGHALVSTWVWKNMLEPVGAKTSQGSISVPSLPLACPDPNCPFIRTNENSKDCSKYMTPVS